jgi:hypothetical protein
MRPVYVRSLITIVVVIVIFGRRFYPHVIPSDPLSLGLLVLALLPWAPYLLDAAEFPGGWKFQFRALAQKADKLQSQMDQTRARIDNLVIKAISPLALRNLEKIASGKFGSYYLGEGLKSQLLYFAAIGYIDFKVAGIDLIPKNGEQPENLELSDFVKITQFGLEYLELRRILAQAPA